METVGSFEFSRKDLIGHGAFAVVFKGRHKEKRDCEVAIKCINKKNLAKSQVLLGKEIKILKELKHENIVGLLDYQEIGGCVYLVMEYCNGGDLAEYLHARRTLSEDTIRVFLQQISRAMKILQSRGIIHRDLKPQNILLCSPPGRRISPSNTCLKIADFGFARHLQTNTMAATLCGSPMYMAPEVIMSQNYDARADLWSIGTVVYQCLTGKAPFYASTPQELRLFYESNGNLLPSIPRETSVHLRHLLLGLLQRNHKDRMTFDEFFSHPFLESSQTPKKSSPVPMIPSYPSFGSGSASSSSGSSISNQPSPQYHSDEEMTPPQHKTRNKHRPPAHRAVDHPRPKAPPLQGRKDDSSYGEDYVMVPAQFPSESTEVGDGSPYEGCLIYTGTSPSSSPQSPAKPTSRTVGFNCSNYQQSVAVPVPTQIHNYQRMEQNLQPAGLHGSTRAMLCAGGSSRLSTGECRSGGAQPSRGSPLSSSPRLQAGAASPGRFSTQVGCSPGTPEQACPLSSRTPADPRPQYSLPCGDINTAAPQSLKVWTAPNLPTHGPSSTPRTKPAWPQENTNSPLKRSWSTGRISDMLLKAAFGTQLLQGELHDSPLSEKSVDIAGTRDKAVAASPSGCLRTAGGLSVSPAVVAFADSPSIGNTPPRIFSESPSFMSTAWLFGSHLHRRAHRESDVEVMDGVQESTLDFHPPELPDDTLMEQAHTNALMELRFTLAFVHCVMEVAFSKDQVLEASSSPDVSFLQQSLVTDQISLLSREWSHAEQLLLYMKCEEFLSSALRAAKEDIKEGRLLPSVTVKQLIRKLNELYKACVTYCRSLNDRLQSFLQDKQRLMDRFNGIVAEKLIYNHAVQMVQSAALDEMFHCSTASIQRYHKGLLLMEGLSRVVTEKRDAESVDKCKQCIERRLASLHSLQHASYL
ncbi:serine/threonine-protein kinase ULK1a isoform X1 [Gadus morhua]|uniref:serine/threonine-protein kinase ULK1a isoform X1 n=2 Tax=Gadus morhua TaxID=8049 RepID=UPI0011B80F17|nr:serine/threonine-protein kinase ULK1-like isoform X1 [Gadus morhua]